MAIEAEKVLAQALSLPESERLSVARRLLESVEIEVECAWEDEIVKRIAQIDAGTAVGRPWEEIKKDFHSRFGR
jgi:putative addiction module component (TIGR02574 family)